jgi:rhodanese-related sulfurtransferase/uncharacterized membrane protein YphA (DoxX/SURF4 family)
MDHWTIRKLIETRVPADLTRPPGDQEGRQNRRHLIFFAGRLLLGGIFVYASFDKILYPASFAEIVYNYQILPDLLVNLTSLFLPWIELLAGLALIVGVWLPGALWIANLLLLVFFGTLIFNTARGLDIDCGCFTISIGPSSGGHMLWYLLRDGFFLFVGVLLFASFFFLKTQRGRRFDGPWKSLFGQTFALALSAALLGLLINQVRSDAIPLRGDWSPEARISLKFGKNILIPFEEAKDKFFAGGALFIDARSPELYREGHIQGALNLPHADFDQLADKVVMNFPEDTLIVTYCDGEDCTLSAELALKLKEIGFENVRVLYDGWNVWRRHQLPTRTGESPG